MEKSVVSIPKSKHFISKEMKILSISMIIVALLTFIVSSTIILYFDGDLLEEDTIGKYLILASTPLSLLVIFFMYQNRNVTGFKVLLYWTLFYTIYNIISIYFFSTPLGFTDTRNNSFNGAILLMIYLPIIFLAFYRYESKTIKAYFVSLLFLSTAYSPFAYYNVFSFYSEIFSKNYISANAVIINSQGYFYQFLLFSLIHSFILVRVYYQYKKDEYIYEQTVITGDFSDFMKLKAAKMKEKEANA